MSKKAYIVSGIIAGILVLGMLAATVMCTLAFVRIGSQQKTVAELSEQLRQMTGMYEDVPQENDVTIGGEYVIRATTDISDAYKSNDDSKLDETDKETLELASNVLDKIITNGMTDFEKERAVYDWMSANIPHDTGLLVAIPTSGEYSDRPFGALKYHTAVCVGYATTFRLFMQMLDIECMVVHDSSLSHSWDLVKLDGEWYHTDVYMDAGAGSYMNFNMNDALCSNAHTWNTTFFPAASGIKYNMAYQQKQDCSSVYDVPNFVARAMQDGETIVALYFAKFDEAAAQITDTMMIQMIDFLSAANYSMSYGMSAVDSGYLLCVYLTDDSESNALDDETLYKISDALQQAFGDIIGDGYYDEYTDAYSVLPQSAN